MCGRRLHAEQGACLLSPEKGSLIPARRRDCLSRHIIQTVAFDDRFLAELNEDSGEFEQGVRLAAATWFYVCHKLTLGQAAEMAGESQYEFMGRLSRFGWSAIDYPAEDLCAEAAVS